MTDDLEQAGSGARCAALLTPHEGAAWISKLKAVRLPVIILLVGLLQGCVLYRHDKKTESLLPANVPLADFAGTYKDQAVYHTAANKLGLMGHPRLSGVLGGIIPGTVTSIAIAPNGDLVVSSDQPRSVKLTFVRGKDYEFKDHRIVFHSAAQLASRDSPGVTWFRGSMQWLLDDAGRLNVLTSSKGLGMVTIIPAAALGGTLLSIFERADKQP
jgi:hypothetical protein